LLLKWRTILDNVLLPAEIVGLPMKAARERARDLLNLVGLAGYEQKYPRELSGGMQQRTAIARALANDPRILLLDEPFGALDNQTRSLMQELLLSIWESERKTVLFVTHDIEEAIFMANRVLVMSARPGRIKAEVSVPLAHPRHYTIKTSPQFSELKAELTEQIRVEAMKST
jgi:ABC-type nitrate/sulfonate/bicarbonate transport system ATPase subunit